MNLVKKHILLAALKINPGDVSINTILGKCLIHKI